MTPTDNHSFRSRWARSVTVGEFVGFLAPAGVGAATSSAPAGISIVALCAAGAFEGTILGWSQARVLSSYVAGFPRPAWVAATAGGAVFAWLIGSLPIAAGDSLTDLPVAAVVLIGTAGGCLLLLSIGFVQWLVIRRAIPNSRRWIVASAVCWLIALTAFVAVSTPLWQPGQSRTIVAAVGAFAGFVMAAVFAGASDAFAARIIVAPRTTSKSQPR